MTAHRKFYLSLIATTALALSVSAHAVFAETAAPAANTSANGSTTLEEVVVTATKREDRLSKIPESVTAITAKSLEIQHIQTVEDLSKITPGLVYKSQAGSGQQRNSAITIRGITSTNGVPTVGVYLDDSPLTIRDIAAAGTNNFFPALFDLSRIEVLRGPQGTLFGAGSEGGTVRFIGEQPSLTTYSGHVLAEGAGTEGGALSYQLGAAVGGPIVEDKLGFRGSIYFRRDGGYVDKYNFNTGALIKHDANTDNTFSGRIAFVWQPIEHLTITPSFFAQKLTSDDINRISLPATMTTIAGIPTGTSVSINQNKGNYTTLPNTFHDAFQVASLNINYQAPWFTVTSVTSHISRIQNEFDDLHTWVQLFDGAPDPFVPGSPNYTVGSPDKNWVHNFAQELRFASNYADSPLSWVGGVYYSRNHQVSTETVSSNTFADLVTLPGLGPYFALFVPDYVQGASYDVFVQQGATETQLAGFGQVDYRLWHAVTLTAGVRVEHDKGSFFEREGGVVGRGGHGPANQLIGPPLTAEESDTAYIPKFSVSWQITEANLVYGSVSKGYRPGGQNTVNAVVPPACAAGLAQLGLSAPPIAYGPDNVWSYEIGTKNRFAGNRLQIDASGFYVKWNAVQQQVNIGCTTPFVANLGEAVSKGFDLGINAQPIPGLTLGASVGYTDTTFEKTLPAGTLIIARAGDSLPNVTPWTVNVSGEYDHSLTEDYGGYFRVDFQWLSKEPEGDPLVTGWDPAIRSNGTFAPNPAYGVLNLRAGVRRGPADLSVFVLNATNSDPRLNYGREQALVSGIFKYNEMRPLTAGVTFSYRY